MLRSIALGGVAVVMGGAGGLGQALVQALQDCERFERVLPLARASEPALDLTREDSIARCASHLSDTGLPLRLVVDATGFLHNAAMQPEKSWQQLDAEHMAHAFAINAIGPALLMKHFCRCSTATEKPSSRPCRPKSEASAITSSAAGTATAPARLL